MEITDNDLEEMSQAYHSGKNPLDDLSAKMPALVTNLDKTMALNSSPATTEVAGIDKQSLLVLSTSMTGGSGLGD